jgi:putative hydrolase of the HAD superfamily
VTTYPKTCEVLARWGVPLTDEELLSRWSEHWMGFEVRSEVDHREFSMIEVAAPFLTTLLGRMPGSDEVDEFVAVYIDEWNGGVYHIDGMADWLTGLAQHYRLVIVSNTHEPDLVPAHLRRMGIADLFDLIVLSVEVGWRKPHPEIYTAAMDRLRLKPENAIFVGDNYLADYLGPSQAGIRAYVIDPLRIMDVPPDRRLGSVFEVAERILLG